LTYNNYILTFSIKKEGGTVNTIATTKGQIVIPAKVRNKFGIREGTRIQIEMDEKGQRIILKPITREYIHSLRGKRKGKGLMKALMEEKRKEREL
jgi:AbrB family looped-hinge helix DNA binding protein